MFPLKGDDLVSAFSKALNQERAGLVADAQGAKLPALRERAEAARKRLEEHRATQQRFIRTAPDPVGDDLAEESNSAARAFAEADGAHKRASARLAEIDGLLLASDRAAAAKKEARDIAGKLRAAQQKHDHLTSIAASLRRESEELTQRRQQALTQYGVDELAARLEGKTLALPKSVTNIDGDLASRQATLAATETARAAQAEIVTQLKAGLVPIKARYMDARMKQAELAYYEMLPGIMPLLATLMAIDSPLSWSVDEPGVVPIRVDDAVVEQAKRALEAEFADI
jgi:hypothetical protein